ncbi:YdcH family protein [Parvularcula marina]|uniref:YdcH family protein n=1 Tax=Parvularcula marina TaxID=2292771 RepID=UPI0035161E76
MTHTPHELSEEFPEFTDTLHRLKTGDLHFQKLSEEYHSLNRDIHRAETDVEPTSDDHLEEMKSRRVRLKDEIYAMLKATV